MASNTNQSRLQELPPFPMCPRHHEQIKGVCLFHGNCADRLLCRTCRKIHDKNHLNNYEGLEDIFNGNLVNETTNEFEDMVMKIENNNFKAKQTSQFLISQIDTQFNEIQGYIIQKLNNVRTKIFDDISQKFRTNANVKQQIITGMNEVRSSYERASQTGFQPQFVILNVIHALCGAQLLKERISNDPELNSQHTGELTTSYLTTVTNGSFLQQVKISFDRICDDIIDSFQIKPRGEQMGFQDINGSLHKLGEIPVNYENVPSNLFPSLNSNTLDYQNFNNMLNTAAANASTRTSIPKGVLKNTQNSTFGNYSFSNQNEQFQSYPSIQSSFGQSNYNSNENSRGFENDFNYNRNQGTSGISESFSKVQQRPMQITQQQQQQQQQASEKSQLDFSSLVKDLTSADLIKVQSELKLKVPQNSFVLDSMRNQQSIIENPVNEPPIFMSFGQNDQMNNYNQISQDQRNTMVEEKTETQIIEEPTLRDPPYEPGLPDTIQYRGLAQGESTKMQEENPQETAMKIEQATARPKTPKKTPLNILEIFQKVQEEEKSSKGRIDANKLNQPLITLARNNNEGGNNRKFDGNYDLRRSVSPMRPEGNRERSEGRQRSQETLKYLSHFYSQHKKISSQAMAFINVRNHLITGGQDGEIRVWSMETKKKLYGFNAHNGDIFKIFYIEEKDMIASCGFDNAVCIWDCKNDYKNVKIFSKHEGPVYALEYVSHMNMMISGGEDGTLRLWSIEGAKEEIPIKIANSHIGSLCYLKMGKKLVVGLDRGIIRFYNLATTPKKVYKILDNAHDTTGFVIGLVAIEERNILLSAAEDGFVKIWRIAEDVKQMSKVGYQGEAVRSFVVNYKQDYIITNHADRRVRVWKGSSGEKIYEKYDKSFGECTILYKETNKIVTANEDEVKLWQIYK